MSLELLVLGLLDEEDGSGYDLRRRVSSSHLGQLWSADQAQIYRTLQRLERDGLVSARRVRQTQRPDRIVFSLNDAGRSFLHSTLTSTLTAPLIRDPFLLQLYFAEGLSDHEILVVLAERRDTLRARLDGLQEESLRLEEQPDLNGRALVLRQTALDGLGVQLRALLDWIEACIQAVESGVLPRSETEHHNI